MTKKMRKKRQLKFLFCTKKVEVSIREQYNGFNCILNLSYGEGVAQTTNG